MDRRILYVLGAAALLSSCAKVEMTDGGKALDPNQIAFSVRSGLQTQPGTRAGTEEEQSAMLLSGQGEDTLYLHPSVVVNDRGFGMPATRGVPVTKDNISSFTVTAKVHGSETPYMNEVEVTRQGDSDVWTTSDGKHFWPDEQTSLDFYAYSNLTETDNPDSPGVSSLTCGEGQFKFSYIVPNGTEDRIDAEQQPDILFALASANRSQTQDGGGTVNLNFEHALAGVQFRAKNIAGGTIKRITLKNLFAEGECTYSLSDSPVVEGGVTKNGTFEWNPRGDKKNFTQTMSVDVKESSTLLDGKLQDVTTGGNAEMTFMMIPQKLENVEVEIVLVGARDDSQYTVSGQLSTEKGSWEAGNIYIYDISTDSINWTYVFEVTSSIELKLGETSKTYNVKSYRYRTQLGDTPENREDIPWNAEGVSATETNREDGTTTDANIDDIITNFSKNGNGGFSSDYPLEITRNQMHTTYDGDIELKDAISKGSPEAPYDLSTSGGTLPRETANCYCVNAPGTYQLPLVYGNAIKGGNHNTSAYNSQFKDYLDNSIENPYIYNNHGYQPYDACLVWSDGFYMFENIHLNEDKTMLVFSLNKDYMQQANAILAVRDEQGQIMWSWHIWVTERSLDEIHWLQDGLGSNATYGMMQCNLGWVDGKMVYYNDRSLKFKFTQTGSGYVKEMTVNQAGDAFDYKDVGSTYYQWGRKDPIVALRNWDTYRFEDYRLHETSDPKYAYNTAPGYVTIGTTIKNPNIFYLMNGSTDWLNGTISSLWDNSSGNSSIKQTSVKTIYDPSPRGYKVPVPRAFSVFVNGDAGTLNGYLFNDNVHNKYRVHPNRNGAGGDIPLTATGQRADRENLEAYNQGSTTLSTPGGLWAMYGVYYWSCVQTPGNTNASYSLCIRNDWGGGNTTYTYTFGGAKTMARPVRPIKDI